MSDDHERARSAIGSAADLVRFYATQALVAAPGVPTSELPFGLAGIYTLMLLYMKALREAIDLLDLYQQGQNPDAARLDAAMTLIAEIQEVFGSGDTVEQIHRSLQHFLHDHTPTPDGFTPP